VRLKRDERLRHALAGGVRARATLLQQLWKAAAPRLLTRGGYLQRARHARSQQLLAPHHSLRNYHLPPLPATVYTTYPNACLLNCSVRGVDVWFTARYRQDTVKYGGRQEDAATYSRLPTRRRAVTAAWPSGGARAAWRGALRSLHRMFSPPSSASLLPAYMPSCLYSLCAAMRPHASPLFSSTAGAGAHYLATLGDIPPVLAGACLDLYWHLLSTPSWQHRRACSIARTSIRFLGRWMRRGM